jgi:hypothetical protein
LSLVRASVLPGHDDKTIGVSMHDATTLTAVTRDDGPLTGTENGVTMSARSSFA